MDQSRKRLDIIDQIRDSVSSASPLTDPFLYYLPDLLVQSEFSNLHLDNILTFTQYAQNNYTSPILKDALHILNQMIQNQDGRLNPPGPQMFYNTQYFFWKELGQHTQSAEVIAHIINKAVFQLALENTH